jgi:vacuolar-type H+-ATPase subunit E/Vma4
VSQLNTRSHDVLRDEILADAQRQAERMIRKAERDAQAIVDKAAAESRQERETKLAAARAAAEHQHVLTLATVPVEIGRLRAIRVERELSALRDQVRTTLLARQGYPYGESLTVLAAEAIACMEGNEFILELSQDDLREFGATLVEAVRKRIGRADVAVSVRAAPEDITDITAGVLIRDGQGRQIWDNSLDARLRRMWPLLRSKVAQQLGLPGNAEPSGEPL